MIVLDRLRAISVLSDDTECMYILHTSSFILFKIHSPPLLFGASRIIPTRANSEHTRKTGRCLVTRAASSFSRCSGARADSAARDGALSAVEKAETRAGVNALGNRR